MKLHETLCKGDRKWSECKRLEKKKGKLLHASAQPPSFRVLLREENSLITGTEHDFCSWWKANSVGGLREVGYEWVGWWNITVGGHKIQRKESCSLYRKRPFSFRKNSLFKIWIKLLVYFLRNFCSVKVEIDYNMYWIAKNGLVMAIYRGGRLTKGGKSIAVDFRLWTDGYWLFFPPAIPATRLSRF